MSTTAPAFDQPVVTRRTLDILPFRFLRRSTVDTPATVDTPLERVASDTTPAQDTTRISNGHTADDDLLNCRLTGHCSSLPGTVA